MKQQSMVALPTNPYLVLRTFHELGSVERLALADSFLSPPTTQISERFWQIHTERGWKGESSVSWFPGTSFEVHFSKGSWWRLGEDRKMEKEGWEE